MEDFFMKLTLEEKPRNVKLHIEDNVPIFEIQRSKEIQTTALFLGLPEDCMKLIAESFRVF